MFSEKDLTQIEKHGLNIDIAKKQMHNYVKGFPFLDICRAAVVGDGIQRLSENEIEKYSRFYESNIEDKTVVKFVPASGAATRMFKALFEYVNEDKQSKHVTEIIDRIDDFAFGAKACEAIKGDYTPKKLISSIINKDGLNYGQSPKALILFHKYNDGNRTAMEEHLAEGAMYAKSGNGTVNIHFTVSPEHLDSFEKLVKSVLPKYENKYAVKYNISYSQQKSSTDTLAADMDNKPFREEDGSLLFRPAGHGALLENLGDINGNIIFIKTVDNVAPDALKQDTVIYKKTLGGLMLALQETIFDYLKRLDDNKTDEKLLTEIKDFIEHKLCFKLPDNYETKAITDKTRFLYDILNRPIRVCGMVKNEGEPGGGPFWTKTKNGCLSLQIAESSQIAPEQRNLMAEATHFNPVDIVCGIYDYKGKKFDLSKFVDPDTGFISVKSRNGRELKAQELPGLWNGAMANWNTIFVEVPITTFSPVKIVNDLLRPQHLIKAEK